MKKLKIYLQRDIFFKGTPKLIHLVLPKMKISPKINSFLPQNSFMYFFHTFIHSNSESESTQVIFEKTKRVSEIDKTEEQEGEEEKKPNHINYTKSMKILIKPKRI
jgi:hypothetical protein